MDTAPVNFYSTRLTLLCVAQLQLHYMDDVSKVLKRTIGTGALARERTGGTSWGDMFFLQSLAVLSGCGAPRAASCEVCMLGQE